MNRVVWQSLAWTMALCLVLAGSVVAQDSAEPMDEAAAPEAAEPVPDVDVDAILEGEDAVYAGEEFTYDPAGRRDPFESLIDARERGPERGPRPEGVEGLLVGEIDLTGIFILPDGPVAQVQATDQDKSFLLRAGDRLFDGTVVNISRDEVVFRQQVDDPAALKPFREVVKKLNP